MTGKRFRLRLSKLGNGMITDTQKRKDLYFDKEFLDVTLPKANKWLNKLAEENEQLKSYTDEMKDYLARLEEENKQLKTQLCYDKEEGICNICKHHYLVKDEETEFGYYNSRCKKGHYECARVSLKYCEDFKEV